MRRRLVWRRPKIEWGFPILGPPNRVDPWYRGGFPLARGDCHIYNCRFRPRLVVKVLYTSVVSRGEALGCKPLPGCYRYHKCWCAVGGSILRVVALVLYVQLGLVWFLLVIGQDDHVQWNSTVLSSLKVLLALIGCLLVISQYNHVQRIVNVVSSLDIRLALVGYLLVIGQCDHLHWTGTVVSFLHERFSLLP